MSSSPAPDRGQLWVVSAPSGTGKTTVVDRLMERTPRLERSRSYTSRAARPGETHGVDYNFISRERFETMVREDAFLEWADIFGNLYGTSRAETEALLQGLEVMPRRQVLYKDRPLDEFDLDAVLARKPKVVLVDELAHQNLPGSRHERRYQDQGTTRVPLRPWVPDIASCRRHAFSMTRNSRMTGWALSRMGGPDERGIVIMVAVRND